MFWRTSLNMIYALTLILTVCPRLVPKYGRERSEDPLTNFPELFRWIIKEATPIVIIDAAAFLALTGAFFSCTDVQDLCQRSQI